jgi:hemolysin activation/secretion protein
MRLMALLGLAGRRPRHCGETTASSRADRQYATVGIALALLFSVLLPVPTMAQQAGQPSFDPKQTEKRFDNLESGQSQPARSGIKLPSFAQPQAANDTRPQFKLRAVTIEGATAMPKEALVGTYQPYLGKKVSQADLAAIALAISDLYRGAGFHLSRAIVPPQDIANGSVRIKVIEGSVTELVLKGDDAEPFGVRPLLAPALAEFPSRLTTLERQLLLIGTRPGVRIADSAIEEVGGLTGRFRLILELKTWHVQTLLGFDNLGSSSVGPWQTYAAAAFNSYLRPGDTLAVNLSTTPGDPRELAFGRLSYDMPIGIDGLRIGASALYSEVRPGDVRRLFNDDTTTEAFEVRASIVPLQSQRSWLVLTAAFDFSNVRDRDIFGPIYNDHIRTVSLTSDYRLQDNFGGNNFFTMTYKQGLDILGASRLGDDWLSHDGASANFSVLDVWFTRYQTLFDAWSLKVAAAGQMASGPLLLSQQFYLGGWAFGRGYGSAEISGDNGIAGSVELRFDHKLNYRYLQGFQLYSFVDAGAAWNDGFSYNDGLALTSAGGGARFFLSDDLQADVGVAFPLSYRAPDNTTRSARLLFSLSSALRLCPERGQGHCL